jgi:hypothetical protein
VEGGEAGGGAAVAAQRRRCGARHRRQGGQSRAGQHVPEEEEERGGVRWSNEEMPKMKVEEFFKPYNISLRFKFKNPKHIALHVKF